MARRSAAEAWISLGLVGHLRGGHEDEAVEPVLGEGILGGSEMPQMNGVEASA